MSDATTPRDSFVIELATEHDVPRILEISNWAAVHTTANFATSAEPLEPWIETWKQTHEHHPWLVARTPSNEIAGFAKSTPHKTRAAYAWCAEVAVYLDPRFHQKGLGSALYGVLLPILKEQGYVTLVAGITGGNTASERLHEKAGFVRCATFHRIGYKFGKSLDVSFFEQHLTPLDATPGRIKSVAEVWKAARAV